MWPISEGEIEKSRKMEMGKEIKIRGGIERVEEDGGSAI